MSGKVKGKILVVVNLFLAVALITQLVTVVFFITGMGGGFIHELHELAGFSFLILAVIHLILNFGWIKSRFTKTKKS